MICDFESYSRLEKSPGKKLAFIRRRENDSRLMWETGSYPFTLGLSPCNPLLIIPHFIRGKRGLILDCCNRSYCATKRLLLCIDEEEVESDPRSVLQWTAGFWRNRTRDDHIRMFKRHVILGRKQILYCAAHLAKGSSRRVCWSSHAWCWFKRVKGIFYSILRIAFRYITG